MRRRSSGAGAELLAALAARRATMLRVAVVVAHPDEETIGLGANLALLRRLTLVHVTDGAPRTLHDARGAGFATAAEYAAARRAELRAALAAGGATAELIELGVPDQGATAAMAGIARELAALFATRRIEAVVTHPYEGGHPDHDATAWAVHAASRSGPAVIEMLSYHAAADGGIETDRFLPGPASIQVTLSPAKRALKRRMLDCFATQAAVLAAFGTESESFRAAPAYDFTASPHPGSLYYDGFNWGMTGAAWREIARKAASEPALCAG